MPEWDIKVRTRDFAHRCIKMCMARPEDYLGSHLKKQLIRCCTSVAANYRAACLAQSKTSFVSKLSIVIEEIDEACFWMEFIIEENLISKGKTGALLEEAKELTGIFIASRKTARQKK